MYTRCPACDTVFQINERQLEAREGVVRCGRCRHIFNARWNLLDIPEPAGPEAERPAPPPEIEAANRAAAGGAPAAGPAAPESTAETPPSGELPDLQVPAGDWQWRLPAADGPSEPAPDRDAAPAPEPPRPAAAGPLAAETLLAQEPDEEIVLDASFVPPEGDQPGPAPASLQIDALEPVEPVAPEPPAPPRRPRRRARRTGAGAWVLGSVLLLAVLIAQVGYFFFYDLAQIPVLRPPLAQACGLLGCHLPPRMDFARIELVRSRIQQYPGRGDVLHIQLELVNRADFVQPFPWLEASLTDRRGRTVARRTFRPAEYLGDADRAARGMPPSVAVEVALEIQNPDHNAVGYELRLLPPPVSRYPDLPWLPWGPPG